MAFIFSEISAGACHVYKNASLGSITVAFGPIVKEGIDLACWTPRSTENGLPSDHLVSLSASHGTSTGFQCRPSVRSPWFPAPTGGTGVGQGRRMGRRSLSQAHPGALQEASGSLTRVPLLKMSVLIGRACTNLLSLHYCDGHEHRGKYTCV